jgi:hypothetical protein
LFYCPYISLLFIAINVSITAEDVEIEASPVSDTKKNYSYCWTGTTGIGYQRKYPCYCSSCKTGSWTSCDKLYYVGKWTKFQQLALAQRKAKGTITYSSPAKSIGGEEFIVENIVAKRTVKVFFLSRYFFDIYIRQRFNIK